MMGTNTEDDGVILESHKTKPGGQTFCNMLPNFGVFFASDRYIPCFSQDSVEIDILLGNANFNLRYLNEVDSANHLNLGNQALVFENIELHMCLVECSPAVDAAIIAAHPQGIFKYLTNNVGPFQSYLKLGQMSHQTQIGASYSSVNAIHVVMVNGSLGTDKHQYTNFLRDNLKMLHC
jgi:hypothetical protein